MKVWICRFLAGATVAYLFAFATARTTVALTCAITATRPPNGAELAVRGGWPEDAPYDFVLIGVIRTIEPVRDPETPGQRLIVDVEAVLVGDSTAPAVTVFNPDVGLAGWPGFEVERRFLIAGYEEPERGFTTFLCTPNQRLDSVARANH